MSVGPAIPHGEVTMSETTSSSVDVKDILVDIIRNDASLCNFVRFTDYGKIDKETNGSRLMWCTIPCNLNNDNRDCNSQIIRIINKLDSKFFYTLFNYDDNSSSIGNDNGIDILYSNNVFYTNSMSADRTQNSTDKALKNIISRMVNLDCLFKIKGTCLTALDFIGKNPNHTVSESDFFIKLNNFIKKFIFVGDKCYMLGVIDRNQNVYISQKTLEIVYKLDETQDKQKFKEIVLKLYSFIGSNCLTVLNMSLSQYISNDITNLVLNQTLREDAFRQLGESGNSEFKDLFNYKFTNDPNTDSYIKDSIKSIIYGYVDMYVKSYYSLKDFSLINIINSTRAKLEHLYFDKINDAYKNGLKISRICMEAGWNVYDRDNYPGKAPNSLNYNDQYIYKKVSITPDTAVLYDSDAREYGVDKYRKLNENGIKYIRNEYGIYVDILFLSLNTGTMICVGKHPNVSGAGQVCMGDLKGKIVFQNTPREQIMENLIKCEKLLTCIHYASSYTSSGQMVFLNPDYSLNYNNFINGFKSDSEAKKAAKEMKIMDAVEMDCEFEEESSNNKTDQEDTTEPEIKEVDTIESDDFEEI